MTRCIIHIGMHKTGSTSIQNSLHGFVDSDFMYANLGSANHSLAIYSLFADHPEKHHIHRANKWDAVTIHAFNKRVQSKLSRAIDDAQGRTLIISGEDIGVLPLSALVKMREFFQAHFDKLEIVGYVRPPAGFIASGFQQKIIGGVGRGVNLEQEYRHFEKNFAKFDEVFGRENVHLWKFDPPTFHGGCVVQDFCKRLGVNLPQGRIVRVNEALTRLAVSLLYIYRKFGLDYGSANMKGPESVAIGNQLKALDDTKFRFSPDVIRPVLENNHADIAWMEARLGQSMRNELGEHQPGDVRDELDLLRPDPVAIGKLLTLLGDGAPKGIKGETPEEVALLVHALRTKAGSSNETENRKMKMTEKTSKPSVEQEAGQINVAALLEQMQQGNPDLLKGLPKPKAAELLRSAFKQVKYILAQTQEGKVAFGGLGQFRVRQVEKEVEGKKVTRTQIVFKSAAPGKGKKNGSGQK